MSSVASSRPSRRQCPSTTCSSSTTASIDIATPRPSTRSGCQHPRVVVGRDIDAIELQHPKCPAPSPQRHGERPSGLAASHAGGGGNHLRFRAMERRGCRRKGVGDCDPFGQLPVSTVARGSPDEITCFAIVQPRADVARGEDAGAGAAHFDERMVQPRRSGRRGREVEQQSVDVGTQVGLTVRARAIERQHERVSRRQHSLGYFVQQRKLARSNEHGAARPVVRDERGRHENRGREQLADPGLGARGLDRDDVPEQLRAPYGRALRRLRRPRFERQVGDAPAGARAQHPGPVVLVHHQRRHAAACFDEVLVQLWQQGRRLRSIARAGG